MADLGVKERAASSEPQRWEAFDLTGRRALVTGAARGIGAAAATALGRHGAELLVADQNQDGLEQTASRLAGAGAKVQALGIDVRSTDDVARMVDAGASAGGIDILVNCAGVIDRKPSPEATLEDLDRLWEVNVRGLYSVTQAFLPQLIERGGGKIVNVGSLGSLLGLEHRAAYAATKGAVLRYTQSLAIDLGGYGICANTIAPGYIETDLSAGWLDGDDSRRDGMLQRIVLKRFGSPIDVEGAFVFLTAPASDYVTGQVLIVDGGWTSW